MTACYSGFAAQLCVYFYVRKLFAAKASVAFWRYLLGGSDDNIKPEMRLSASISFSPSICDDGDVTGVLVP